MLSHPDLNKDNIATPGISDRQLVKHILNGNTFLAAQFLKKDCCHIFMYIKNARLKNLDLSIDDMINDFYIYLQENNWEKLRTFRFESKLRTWTATVATRYLVKKYSKELKDNTKTDPPIDENFFGKHRSSEGKMNRAELIDAINKLPNKRDKLILLFTLDGYETEEIAENMKISINNVYLLRNRAIKHLRELILNDK